MIRHGKLENHPAFRAKVALAAFLKGEKTLSELATASYNAGAHRVKEWLPANGEIDADVWVDGIPFNETRNYVKNVLGFTTVYDYRLRGDTARLGTRMPTVPGNGAARPTALGE